MLPILSKYLTKLQLQGYAVEFVLQYHNDQSGYIRITFHDFAVTPIFLLQFDDGLISESMLIKKIYDYRQENGLYFSDD